MKTQFHKTATFTKAEFSRSYGKMAWSQGENTFIFMYLGKTQEERAIIINGWQTGIYKFC